MIAADKFYIGFCSINPDLYMQNSAILSFFGDMAGIHSEEIGDSFNGSDLRWLLIGYKINVKKRPKHGSKVEIRTWSTHLKNFSALREFEIRDLDGNLLISGLSEWIRVNIYTKKFERLTPESIEAYESEPERTNFPGDTLKRIKEPDVYEYENSFTIDWRWIDINNHMNNSYYTDVAEHTLPDDVKKKLPDMSFNIMYKHEILENDVIRCFYAETDTSYIVTIKSEDLKTLHAIIEYQK